MRRFEEIGVIGDGAFGIVQKCRDKETGEIVAIKKMKQRYATFDECLQLKEVKSLRKIKHENVMRLLQVFRENDHLYLVTEFYPDGSLLKTIQNHNKPFTEDEVRNVIGQLLEGLAFVHRQGFFHRDIKPENLLWSGNTLKIADFGLAREIRSRPPYTEYVSTRWYRAPEIVLHHEFYNSPVDIWAVGCIMAELFTLRPLFQGNSETDQIFKICSILGTPGPGNWPDGQRLATRLGIRLPQSSHTPLSVAVPNASQEAISLLKDLLQLDPMKRPSATQALQHPFFKNHQQKSPEPTNNANAQPQAKKETQSPSSSHTSTERSQLPMSPSHARNNSTSFKQSNNILDQNFSKPLNFGTNKDDSHHRTFSFHNTPDNEIDDIFEDL
ncbi:hypothetical protein M9Y10_004580 [Tritrichomonas musculus]|uniref:Protein kinase domain-containing protein n=1 Tax=Tritrichomonas musculus TaxID=1915356 RepID=A0ABR2JJN9_9EUKA